MAIATRRVEFYQDDGYLIKGDLTEPASSVAYERVIVFCPGFSGVRSSTATQSLLSVIAETLNVPVLAFDYSGFGESEGPKGRLDPLRQVQDVRTAITFAELEYPSLRGTVGLVGISFGGGIATVAAATDKRIRSVIAIAGITDGSRWMKDLRPYWEWLEFAKKIDDDRASRAVSGRSAVVEHTWIIPPHPVPAAFAATPSGAPVSALDVVSVERIVEFSPISVCELLRERAALFLHGSEDSLIPVEHSIDLARAAGGRYQSLEGLGHYDAYSKEGAALIATLADTWYKAEKLA